MNLEHIYKEMMAERACKDEPEGTIIGTCQEFCPKFEFIERTIRGDISNYEQQILFKKYFRSSAGKSKSFPEDVRPLKVLIQATDYLIDLSFNDFSLEMYKFIDNRTRAIRLDLSVQSLSCKAAIGILEKIARFYIIYNYALFDNKEFEAHLNQEQLKKISSTLDFMYKKNNIQSPEFLSYAILLSMDDKFPQHEQYIHLEKVERAYSIRKLYQQGNYYKYFQECRKLDFLSFSVALMSFDVVRMKAIEAYGKCLVEKIDLSFFNELLYTSDIETQSILAKMNVEIVQNKADFRDKDIYETETDVIKQRKELVGLDQPSIFIYIGDLDYNIVQTLIKMYLIEFIHHEYNKTVTLQQPDTQKGSIRNKSNSFLVDSICDILRYKLSKDYARIVLNNLQVALTAKERKKQLVKSVCFTVLHSYLTAQTLEYMQNYLKDYNLKAKVNEWIRNCLILNPLKPSTVAQESTKATLALVLDDSIYSVLLRNTIEKSKLNEQNPVFYNYKNVLIAKLIKHNLIVFSVDKVLTKEINEKYFMLNKIVDTPQNLIHMLDVIEETLKNSKKILKSKLNSLLKDKNKNKQIFIVTQLIESRRNSVELEDILIRIGNNKKFKDIDVYYEEQREF